MPQCAEHNFQGSLFLSLWDLRNQLRIIRFLGKFGQLNHLTMIREPHEYDPGSRGNTQESTAPHSFY